MRYNLPPGKPIPEHIRKGLIHLDRLAVHVETAEPGLGWLHPARAGHWYDGLGTLLLWIIAWPLMALGIVFAIQLLLRVHVILGFS